MTNGDQGIRPKRNVAVEIALTVLVIATLTIAFKAQQAAAQDWWPMFHHDLRHTGYSTSFAPDTNEVRWSFNTGWAVYSCPTVVDGRVYVGASDYYSQASSGQIRGKLYCLDATTGDSIWCLGLYDWMDSSPAVVDGKVYVGSWDGRVYCLSAATGGEIWRFPGGHVYYSSPAVVDGRVYVGAGNSVYCLPQDDPNGNGLIEASEVIWSYTTGSWVVSSPAVADGRVYVGSDDRNVYCLDAATGNYGWSYATGGRVLSSPAVVDGKVYVLSHDMNAYCLHATTGALIWSFDTGSGNMSGSSPAVAYGYVYVGSPEYTPGKKLYCLPQNDPNGDGVIDSSEVVWSYTTGGCVSSSPAVADGKVYVGSHDHKVYCLDAFTGASIWSYSTGDAVYHSSPAVADGKVYVGSLDGKVYAFGTPPPACQVSPTSLGFGSVFVGGYLDKTFTITNTGGGTLTGSVSESCDHYGIVSGAGAYSLGAGESVTVTVRFQPASIGDHNCIIETGNDLCSDVSCTGEGESPCQVWPANLSFGTVTVATYLDKIFTITNIGGGTLNGSVSESCDHYSIVSGGGAYSLGAGDSVVVTVRFEPASSGQHDCTIETGNDLCGDVFCTGVGESPCQVSPTSLNFGTIIVGSYLDKSFTVTNIGEGSLSGTISESCDHYSIVSGEGSYVLATGEYLTVTVRFEPTSPGQHNCAIETGNDLCSDVYCAGVGRGEWYWKLAYEDYAPNGMVDIDQKQDGWLKFDTDQWSFCGPCAVANCFKWFDSKYNEGLGGGPGDGMDAFPLVRDYLDQLPPFLAGWDDHDPWNVDHTGTPWNPAMWSPPPTDQPFVPGPQPQPSSMPPWGELVERLAWYFNTDGIQTGYCNHAGASVPDMQQGIQDWLESEMFNDGSYLADTLCVAITARPTFAYVESLVEESENVILLLGFWYLEEAPAQQQSQRFIRGDLSQNGVLGMEDILACWDEGPFPCDDAADADDDGILDAGIEGADCEYISDYLFSGGPPPPAPYPNCGLDPTPDELDCGNFAACGQWRRVGGHYVTVAGVNSIEQKIAFSDPFIDAAELGLTEGRVGDGSLIPHAWGSHDPAVHNDEGNVSHDMYTAQESEGPAGRWHLVDYAVASDPHYWTGNFFAQNVPEEFVSLTQPWDGVSPIFTEVEYCIHVSPWDYRGDCNGDGEVDIADVIWELNYLFKDGAPPPWPAGDVNCDGVEDLGDVIFKLNYLFKDGDFPRCCGP